MKIYKYPIPMVVNSSLLPAHKFTLELPKSGIRISKILAFQVKDDLPYIWAAIPDKPHDEMEKRNFEIYGTGQEIEYNRDRVYIGTIQLDEFVWHLFEVVT